MSMQRKYRLFPIDKEYLEIIESKESIKLTIVGKDPFPVDAKNIPFVKSNWNDLDGKSAGRYLFTSLLPKDGIDKYETPRDAAFYLLEKGVVLLNASYNYLEKEKISIIKHRNFVFAALETNFDILNKSQNVLMCGDARLMLNWVIEYGDNFISVPHPSLQSKNQSVNKNDWNKYWEIASLKKLFNLST